MVMIASAYELNVGATFVPGALRPKRPAQRLTVAIAGRRSGCRSQ
jgi:hypothetical protein